jgi:hypothetical protein
MAVCPASFRNMVRFYLPKGNSFLLLSFILKERSKEKFSAGVSGYFCLRFCLAAEQNCSFVRLAAAKIGQKHPFHPTAEVRASPEWESQSRKARQTKCSETRSCLTNVRLARRDEKEELRVRNIFSVFGYFWGNAKSNKEIEDFSG